MSNCETYANRNLLDDIESEFEDRQNDLIAEYGKTICQEIFDEQDSWIDAAKFSIREEFLTELKKVYAEIRESIEYSINELEGVIQDRIEADEAEADEEM